MCTFQLPYPSKGVKNVVAIMLGLRTTVSSDRALQQYSCASNKSHCRLLRDDEEALQWILRPLLVEEFHV